MYKSYFAQSQEGLNSITKDSDEGETIPKITLQRMWIIVDHPSWTWRTLDNRINLD